MPLIKDVTTEQRVLVSVYPKTLGGKPTTIDGAPKFVVESGDGTITPHESDPMKAWLNAGETPGETVFLISADVRMGPDVVEVSDTVTLRVTSPEAVDLGVIVEEPEIKPE